MRVDFPESISPGPISSAGVPLRCQPAMARFLARCRHDPVTGCVLWTGGRTAGRGHSAPYGSFWFEGRRWFAHRWAALHIHGLDIDGAQVDHECCNTLCVHHLQALPAAVNRALQNRVFQTLEQRRYWVHVQVGLEPPPALPAPETGLDAIPFFTAPTWLAGTKNPA